MKFLFRARHWFWLAPLVLGVVFIGGGIYMMIEGNDAKNEVRDALVRENVVVSRTTRRSTPASWSTHQRRQRQKPTLSGSTR